MFVLFPSCNSAVLCRDNELLILGGEDVPGSAGSDASALLVQQPILSGRPARALSNLSLFPVSLSAYSDEVGRGFRAKPAACTD